MKSVVMLMVAAVAGGAFAEPVNLAKGRPYAYNLEPDYPLSKDAADTTQLTDGAAGGSGADGYGWTKKEAVTWNLRNKRLSITVDLGKSEGLSGFSVDVAAGAANVPFPESILVYASDDGASWRYLGDLYAKSCAENASPMFNGMYEHYFARSSKMPGRGRWVTFVVEDKWLFCTSEIEIYAGEPPEATSPATVADPLAHAASARAVARIRRDLDATDPGNAALAAEIDALAGGDDLKALETVLPLNDVQRRVWARNAVRLRAAGWTKPAFWFGDRWANLDPLTVPDGEKVKVRGEGEEKARGEGGELRVRMMRNETRATAVNVVNPTDAALACMVTVEGFPACGGIDCREVLFTDTKLYATVAGALRPGQGKSVAFEIPAGASKQAWISFNRPKCAAGTYPGRVVATLGDGTSLETPIVLEVADLDFPDRPRCHVGGFDYQCGDCSSFGIPKATKANVAMMREIYADCPWATREVMAKGAKYDAAGALTNEAALAWDKWDEWVARFPDAGRYCIYADCSHRDKDRKFAYQGETPGTPRFNRMVESYYAAWRRQVVRSGVDPKKVLVLLMDEPGEWKPEHKEIAEVIVAYAKAIKRGAPEFTVFEDPDYNVDPRLDGEEQFEVCDALCPQVAITAGTNENARINRDYFRGLGRKGKELWLYSCSGPSREMDPVAYYRQMYWLAYQWGAVGCHYWAFGAAPGGDSWHAYLQKSTEYSPWFVSPTDVMAAKQSEGIREGVEDYEYLKMLEDEIARARAAGRDVSAAERTLAAAPALALNQTGEGGRTDGVRADDVNWNKPKDRGAPDAARLKVLDAILSLRRATSDGQGMK